MAIKTKIRLAFIIAMYFFEKQIAKKMAIVSLINKEITLVVAFSELLNINIDIESM